MKTAYWLTSTSWVITWIWVISVLGPVGCSARVHVKTRPKPPMEAEEEVIKQCRLSLEEFINSAEWNRLCSVACYEDHYVTWIIEDVQSVSTGGFYHAEHLDWDVDIFLGNHECGCAPALPVKNKCTVVARISSLWPGRIQLLDATVKMIENE